MIYFHSKDYVHVCAACLKIFHHEKEIFATTFQISIRNLEAVKVVIVILFTWFCSKGWNLTFVVIWQVPQSCQAGTLLENLIFEVSDSDGLIDESIHGPLHTLSIRSNEKLVEGAQYTFERGRCIVSHVPVPREPGTVTFVAYHTRFPDLETTIQVPILYNSYCIFMITLNWSPEFSFDRFLFILLIWCRSKGRTNLNLYAATQLHLYQVKILYLQVNWFLVNLTVLLQAFWG
jgi:hypothetical protein